jgi:hypothetical protein
MAERVNGAWGGVNEKVILIRVAVWTRIRREQNAVAWRVGGIVVGGDGRL